jgi:GT2 family glycosyltransferase
MDLPARRDQARDAHQIDVSVIIVSWNVSSFLRKCIQSIHDQENASFQIIVVDNASTDDSVDMVRRQFADVTLVAEDSNLGFGPANNVGLSHAEGRYVFLLNPDTLVSYGALTELMAFLDQHPAFEMVGPRLVGPDGGVQRVCARSLPTLTQALFYALYLHRLPHVGARLAQRLMSPYDLDDAQEVGAISGAAMFARRSAIEEIGGFDEVFLHTAEDVDLCLRLKQRGGRIFYLPQARIVHFGGQSAAFAPARAATMGFISMHEYFRRSGGRASALAYRLIVQVIQMPLLLLVGFAKALLSQNLDELRERSKLARAIWRWQVAD